MPPPPAAALSEVTAVTASVRVPPPTHRIERGHCSYRNWHHGNKTDWITYTYAVESILIELFQTSEHRTFDPEEADYFFVPTMAGCIYDVFGWNPIPMWPPRIHGEMMFSPHLLPRPLWHGAHGVHVEPSLVKCYGGHHRDHIGSSDGEEARGCV